MKFDNNDRGVLLLIYELFYLCIKYTIGTYVRCPSSFCAVGIYT